MAAKRPNILMFIPHDLGDYVHCYGHRAVRSPNLDQLAATGVRFTDCFTSAPECTPSRSGLFTGLYTHQNGLMGLTHRGWSFFPETVHLAKRLWDAGYSTNLFGAQHESQRMLGELGYDCIFAQQFYASSAEICSEAAHWLERNAVHEDKPWFACVGFEDTHRPWRPARDFGPNDVELPPYLPDAPEVRADLAELYQSILDMDTAIGRVLDALERTGLAEHTLVVYTVDHGIPFPRAKSTYYDPGIRVPMILRLPGRFMCGREYGPLISNLDFTPTLLELCGITVPEELEGRSFLNLLDGKPYAERDAVYGALYYDAFYDPMHSVRTKRYKYIRSFAVTLEESAGAEPDVLAKHETGTWIRADDSDVQRSPTWQYIKRSGPFPLPPPEELYDLEKDPLEQHNVAGTPACAAFLDDARSKLKAMMERTNSPLLKGHVSPNLSSTRNQHLRH